MRRLLIRMVLFIPLAALSGVAFTQSPRPDLLWLGGGHNSNTVSVAYSPDGATIGSAGYFSDSTIKLWRRTDGVMIRTLPGSQVAPFIFGPLEPVTFFPDGKTIVAIGEGSAIGWWNVASGRLMQTVPTSGSDIAIDRTGSFLAVGTRNGTVQILRATDGLLQRTLTAGSGEVDTVCLSADGAIVAGGDTNGVLRTWRVSDGVPLLNFQAHPSSIDCVRISPDGSMIATAGIDQVVRLWNLSTGALLGALMGHTNTIQTLAFSPDGAFLASGSWDDTVRLWSMPLGAPAGTLNLPFPALSVAFNPSSSKLAIACDQDLREYNVADRTLVRSLLHATQPITGTRFTADGTKLVGSSYDHRFTVWDSASGSVLRQINAPFGINSMALSPDGATVAGGVVDHSIRMYHIADGSAAGTINPGTYTYSLAFSPNGAILASGQLDGNVRLYNTSDWSLAQTLTGHTRQVNGLAYASDGSFLVSASEDQTARIWSAQGNLIRTLVGAGGILQCIALSPDNQFALGGTQSGRLTLWRISTGQIVYAFDGHATEGSGGGVLAVRFAPSGFAFYSGGGDGFMKVWRTSDGALLNSYSQEVGGPVGPNNGTQSLDISPDGKWLAYGRDDATVGFAYNALIAAPTSIALFRGRLVSGSFQDLAASDDGYLIVRPGLSLNSQESPVQLDIAAHTPILLPTRLYFQIESSASEVGLRQEVWLQNNETQMLELVDSRTVSTSDQSARIDLGSNFSRFLDSGGNLRARVKWRPGGPIASSAWQIKIDQAVWSAGF